MGNPGKYKLYKGTHVFNPGIVQTPFKRGKGDSDFQKKLKGGMGTLFKKRGCLRSRGWQIFSMMLVKAIGGGVQGVFCMLGSYESAAPYRI